MDTRFTYSVLINVEAWILFLCNILCLYCILKGKLISKSANPIYLIIGYNLVSNTSAVFLYVVFVGPSIYLGKRLYDAATVVTFVSILLWFNSLFIQMVLALNRASIFVFPQSSMFTHKRIFLALLCATAFSMILTIMAQQVLNCCRIVYDPSQYGFRYTPPSYSSATNYSEKFIHVPLNLIASVVCLVSYTIFFGNVFKMKRNVKNASMVNEIRLCVQCALMFLIFTSSWVIFMIIPLRSPEWRMVHSMITIIILGADALIYLLLNKEIKSQLGPTGGWFPKLLSSTFRLNIRPNSKVSIVRSNQVQS